MTHPRKTDLYDIFCAVLYVLKEGGRWRSLPHDFPRWQNVYYHFRVWKEPKEDGETLLDKVMRKLVENERVKNKRNEQTSMIIVDSRSVKNAFTATEKGYDAKKTSGIKLHIAVDTNGLPHAMFISTANMTDRDGGRNLIGYAYPHLSMVKKVMVDSGYSGATFAQDVLSHIGAQTEVVKRTELHTFKVLPKRWVVERSFSWLDHCRRLWKNCDRLLHTSLQMTKLAFISLRLRRC